MHRLHCRLTRFKFLAIQQSFGEDKHRLSHVSPPRHRRPFPKGIKVQISICETDLSSNATRRLFKRFREDSHTVQWKLYTNKGCVHDTFEWHFPWWEISDKVRHFFLYFFEGNRAAEMSLCKSKQCAAHWKGVYRDSLQLMLQGHVSDVCLHRYLNVLFPTLLCCSF